MPQSSRGDTYFGTDKHLLVEELGCSIAGLTSVLMALLLLESLSPNRNIHC